jgi:hypothetical protein
VSERALTVLVSGSSERASLALAAALAAEAAELRGDGVLLAEVSAPARRRQATLLAAPPARRLEAALRALGLGAVARGHLCHLGIEASEEGIAGIAGIADAAGARLRFVQLPAAHWVAALDCEPLRPDAGLLLVRLPRERSLAALAVGELRRRGARARVATEAPSALAARRALAGVRAGGRHSAGLGRIARSLLGAAPLRGQAGQALPIVLGAALALIGCALILAAIGAAVTGKGRVQRAADLAALSAARSMRDEMPRLLAPPLLPDGSVNPRHLDRATYLAHAERAALDAGERNGVAPERLEVEFPDARSNPPLRARVRVRAEIGSDALPVGAQADRPPEPVRMVASAVAEASPPTGSWTGMPERAEGGGYSGPLVYRDGEGMRPDVAAAYDRMATTARAAGHQLAVTSGFRSDAEQAALFEAHPDPRWVAPPGRSLHRCATELDLGPPSAYGWLAANSQRFGFLRRYSWEAWHFGFTAGPPPCSAAGESGGLGSRPGAGADGAASARALPAFVPARFRGPLLRSAGRWNVSAALLAAQIEAESGFDPGAVSPAGAEGIAQFMPGTAASYGLSNPFDPAAAIDAQAHLMSDLLRQFRSIPLALAAYNAGPGAVAPCSCVPPYPETRAYVARILALLDGAGALLAPALEVRLVR